MYSDLEARVRVSGLGDQDYGFKGRISKLGVQRYGLWIRGYWFRLKGSRLGVQS